MEVVTKPSMKVLEIAFTYAELTSDNFKDKIREALKYAEIDAYSVVGFRLKGRVTSTIVPIVTGWINTDISEMHREFGQFDSRIIING